MHSAHLLVQFELNRLVNEKIGLYTTIKLLLFHLISTFDLAWGLLCLELSWCRCTPPSAVLAQFVGK